MGHQSRWQKSHSYQRQVRNLVEKQEKSTKDHLDHPLPTKAQERFHDRNRIPKEKPKSLENSTRYCRTILGRNSSQKDRQARSQESSEGRRYRRCQTKEEGSR